MKHIELGVYVRDTITGFAGVAVARTEFLHGCMRYEVEPSELKDGDLIPSRVFDEPRLKRCDEPAKDKRLGFYDK
jgi:hypothetical protein